MAGILSPDEILEYAENNAIKKDKLSFKKLGLLSFLAGVYITMGGLLSIMVGFGFPELAHSNPVFYKLGMGIFFPVGIILVAIAGAELFTGNTSYFIPALINKRVKWSGVLRNWSIVWIFNFIGSLFFLYFFIYLTGVIKEDCWVEGLNKLALAKTSKPFFITLLKGIAANWLVCLAMWLGMSSKSTAGKILGLWWPVMTFVTMGYEHSIANMFFLPMAMLNGTDISVVDLFVKNLIPATIGNIIGGAVFVGGFYSCIYNSESKKNKLG